MLKAIPCALMRGGTSKGLYFLKDDLPTDTAQRDSILLAAMGSPDARQIDGVGGAHPLTSKVAIVGPSTHPDADVDYLFLQVVVDQARVLASQNCGNILAGVGPFALERGLIKASSGETDVVIHMLNTGSLCSARVQTPETRVEYEGDTAIDGVPGTHAPVSLSFIGIEGASCGSLLPTGSPADVVQGVEVSCIDNGMPVILIDAESLGLGGYESPSELEENNALRQQIEAIRKEMGPKMNLGDVSDKTVPKISIIAPPTHGGSIATRTFIPHRVHEAIGVLGAVSVASAAAVPGTVAAKMVAKIVGDGEHSLIIEHPTGSFTVELEVTSSSGGEVSFNKSALVRTARMLMDGRVYVSQHLFE
jgi:4-oxalomesaconate tautomerase